MKPVSTKNETLKLTLVLNKTDVNEMCAEEREREKERENQQKLEILQVEKLNNACSLRFTQRCTYG